MILFKTNMKAYNYDYLPEKSKLHCFLNVVHATLLHLLVLEILINLNLNTDSFKKLI